MDADCSARMLIFRSPQPAGQQPFARIAPRSRSREGIIAAVSPLRLEREWKRNVFSRPAAETASCSRECQYALGASRNDIRLL
jgi:hypothetical protein